MRLNNMTPVVLHQDGRAVAVLGGSGGRRIWPGVAQVIVNHVDFGMPLQEAIQAPRMHVESDDPVVDSRFGEAVIDELRARGHRVETEPEHHLLSPWSEPNGIAIDEHGTMRSGVYPFAKPTHAGGL